MKPLSAVIIDDEQYACERLRRLLIPFSSINVINCSTSSQKGLDFIQEHKPDLVFLDVELENNKSGFEILEQIDENLYRPTIIMVTAHTHYSIKAMKHEVFDYLVKPVDIDELKTTIDRVLHHLLIRPSKFAYKFASLSKREHEILQFVLEGKSSGEIAGILFISINTVHTHRRNILKKTGARSVLDLFRIENDSHD